MVADHTRLPDPCIPRRLRVHIFCGSGLPADAGLATIAMKSRAAHRESSNLRQGRSAALQVFPVRSGQLRLGILNVALLYLPYLLFQLLLL